MYFVDTLKYGRYTLKFLEMQSTIIAKDAERRYNGGSSVEAKRLIVREREQIKGKVTTMITIGPIKGKRT